jgi:hypothetical protein
VDSVAGRDVSSAPPFASIVGQSLTAVAPRLMEGRAPTGVSLRFGDTVLHVHVEFDELYVTWGGDMPPFGSEY